MEGVTVHDEYRRTSEYPPLNRMKVMPVSVSDKNMCSSLLPRPGSYVFHSLGLQVGDGHVRPEQGCVSMISPCYLRQKLKHLLPETTERMYYIPFRKRKHCICI